MTADSKSSSSPKNVVNGFRTLFVEFCAETSIHGVRYFAARKRHWAERWEIYYIFCIILDCIINNRSTALDCGGSLHLFCHHSYAAY